MLTPPTFPAPFYSRLALNGPKTAPGGRVEMRMSDDTPDNAWERLQKRFPDTDVTADPITTSRFDLSDAEVSGEYYVDADDVTRLVSLLDGQTELVVDEFRLATSEGEFVFRADDGVVVVTHECGEEDE